ncbi:TolC family protein [Devosia algicola]|uniref:TolC family protein n=1 Tax=Devosia algicola TaxID=3026418 RepID=A0ABY7YK38_9HYPH|nr:TolC family protein [Devosia algicola]WDR01597.1 TolC family protein [Devosia algicola]
MPLTDVIAYTLKTNPDIGIARAQAQDASAGVGVAQVPYMPTVDYSAAYGPERTYAYDTEITTQADRAEASIRASQLLFDFGKTASDVDRAKALEKSASLRLDAKTTEVITAAVEAYLAVLELDLQIANSRKNEAAHEQMHHIVTLNEQGGNGTMADVQKALTRLDAARAQTIDLVAERRTAASTFERVTGMSPGSLRIPTPPKAKGKVSDADISRYAATDPQLLSIKQDKASLLAQIKSLQLDYLPKVTLEGSAHIQMNVGGNNPARTDARAMLSINGSLFDGGDRAGKIQQIEARVSETEYRYRRTLDNLRFDVDDADRVLDTAASRLGNIAGRIKSGEDVVDLYTQQFQGGTRGIFELLDAQQELSSARSEQITAQFDVLRAQYRMLRLTGELTQALSR